MGHARRVAVIALVVAAALHVARGTLFAHAMLVSAEPAAESVVAVGAARIRLLFSEEIEPTLAHISLVASDGRVTRLPVRSDPRDVDALLAAMTPLPRGGYRVQWHVVSADGHPVGGTFVFWVGDKLAPAPAIAAADDSALNSVWGPSVARAPLIPGILRGVAVGTAMSLAGLLFFLAWARRSGLEAIRAERAARGLVIATPLLLVASALAWTMNASPGNRLTGGALTAALSSDVGRLELWRIGAALLAAWALLLARRRSIALACAAAVLALSGATGHSAAIRPMVAAPAKALHLFAGAAWLGGLLWLVLAARGDRDGEGYQFTREALRVSTVALWASIAVAASGILMSLLFLSTPRDLVDTAYGAVLLAKIVGLLVLVAFGAYHRFRALPALSAAKVAPATLAATVRRELAIMVVVVLLGGFLAYVPPGRQAGRPGSLLSTPVE